MFDNIKVETKLPTNKLIQKFLGKDFDLTGFEYQTKDLDNALLTYTIKKNGDLFVERIEYRDSTPEEKKQDIKTYGKQFGSFRLKVNSRIWEKTNHTGDVEFYAYEKAKHVLPPAANIPVQVLLRYYDAERDYQVGIQQSGSDASGRGDMRLELPAVLSAATAKALADLRATDRARDAWRDAAGTSARALSTAAAALADVAAIR
jgi:hypothetical protein